MLIACIVSDNKYKYKTCFNKEKTLKTVII